MARGDDSSLDASRPLLGSEHDGYDRTLHANGNGTTCKRHKKRLLLDDDQSRGSTCLCSWPSLPLMGGTNVCTESYCWKLVFPERISDYDDFATSAQMGEVHYIRQKAREFFDISVPEDEDMVRNLWTGLFPTLPYEHHVNARWRDVGFQNDDLTSDLRASGRLGLRMLLYFADHMNDAFKRMIHDNNFPVCVCGLNVVEMLLIHLNLKDPVPLVCPCCGTDNAEMETNHPVRTRPELKGFASLVQYTSSAGSSNQLLFAEWPIDVAFAQVFMHSMLVLDAVWKQKLYADPSTNLLHFREALYDTRVLIIDFFATRGDAMHPITVRDLAAWSQQHVQAFDRKRGV